MLIHMKCICFFGIFFLKFPLESDHLSIAIQNNNIVLYYLRQNCLKKPKQLLKVWDSLITLFLKSTYVATLKAERRRIHKNVLWNRITE